MDQDQDVESIRNQLSQMKSILPFVSGDEEKAELQNVINQLQDLVTALSAAATAANSQVVQVASNQEVDDEYAMFSAEIASIEQEFNNNSGTDSATATSDDNASNQNENEGKDRGADIQEELVALQGMRCLAPHEEQWGQIGYYPAMVSEVVNEENDSNESSDGFNCISEIKVRVVFLQPVVKSQLMCPFFKEDRCKFSDFDCGYSHGEVVPFIKLRDYSEPDYTQIIPSARVLAKYHDDLWYNGTVLRLTSEGNCEVQFDKDDECLEVGIHETSPLQTTDETSESDEDDLVNYDDTVSNVECDLLSITSSDVLGNWEKHTTGFGSRLMMKMGYIMGAGLGRQSEGRVIPVDAIMVPPGMSLDQFMIMKEKRKIGNEGFSVEKTLKRAQKMHSHKERQISERKKVTSVFEFMNSRLSLRKDQVTANKPSFSGSGSVAKKTCSSLKKDMLSVGEEVRKVNNDIKKVKQSLQRNEGRDSATEALMKTKLGELEIKKNELVRIENNIVKEQKNRSDKKKLTEF